ncbi:MAG: type II secretion system protein [Lentisphaerae bacterium]|nr:type II secretion system protein [Lentisphaerota bacterium]
MRKLWAERKNRKRSGFTLVEIIAVLVILAILTAIAVPKYFDLSEEAKNLAVKGAVAEGLSVCSLAYAKEALAAAGEPAITDVRDEAADVVIAGDFTYTYTVNGTTIEVDVSGKAGSTVAGATGQGIWTMP